jgi:serine/threonine protein kinase
MGTRLLEREQNPASLKEGTRVGPWRVVSWRGQGTYGTVYRAVRDGREEEGFFALKMANHARDERFEREGELLSLIRHPNVPRLHGQGYWECALGVFPYLVMEWVEGVPLYDWSSQRNPTQRQVMEVVAQVAGALVAVEAAGGVHRDVKGDNVLVRLADGRPFLTDFGSGVVEGAPVLTVDILPPNTIAYRSPEAWAYQRFNSFQARAHYEASASDDLFALGVMAYRLVTDEYPPPTQPEAEGSEVWQWNGKGPRPPSALNAQKDLVSQRLGHRPRHREPEVVQRAKERDASARVARERQEALERRRAQAPTEKEGARFPTRRLLPVAAALVLVTFLVVAEQPESSPQWEAPAVVKVEPGQQEEGRDGGPVGLGDGFSSVAPAEEMRPHESAGFAVDVPKTPLDGQLRAPCRPRQLEILGGCWYEAPGRVKPPCEQGSYEWEGNCYVPLYPPRREPASDEP